MGHKNVHIFKILKMYLKEIIQLQFLGVSGSQFSSMKNNYLNSIHPVIWYIKF